MIIHLQCLVFRKIYQLAHKVKFCLDVAQKCSPKIVDHMVVALYKVDTNRESYSNDSLRSVTVNCLTSSQVVIYSFLHYVYCPVGI